MQGPTTGAAQAPPLVFDAEAAWDAFLRDGLAFEGGLAAQQAAAQPAATAATDYSAVTAAHADALDFDLQELQCDSPLDSALLAAFAGADGDELLGPQFAPLLSPCGSDNNGTAVAPAPAAGGGDCVPDVPTNDAVAAMAVLGDLGEAQPAAAPHPAEPPSPAPAPALVPGLLTPVALGLQQMALATPPPPAGLPTALAGAALPPGYQFVQGPTLYLDRTTGQLLQLQAANVAASPFLLPVGGAQALGLPQPGAHGGPQAFSPLGPPHAMPHLAFPLQQHAAPGSYGAARAQPTARPPRPAAPKRKSACALPPQETPQERAARLAAGFTLDPKTGRLLRHGPALLAAAKVNADNPVVTAIYTAYAAQPFPLASPAAPPACLGAAALPMQWAEQQAPPAHPASPGPSIASSGNQAAAPRAGTPTSGDVPEQAGQRAAAAMALLAGTGGRRGSDSGRRHGLITAGVAQELLNAPAPATLAAGALLPATPQAPTAFGVTRTPHEAAWTAWGEAAAMPAQAAEGPLLGLRRESQGYLEACAAAAGDEEEEGQPALVPAPAPAAPAAPAAGAGAPLPGGEYLGSFATLDAARRAADLYALKVHGPAQARTNLPLETYADVLPLLADKSTEMLVATLRKDQAVAAAAAIKRAADARAAR